MDNKKSINYNSTYIIKTYEKVLNNEIKTFSPYFFDQQYRKIRIITLVRYLIEEKLKITPEEALEKVNKKTFVKYKLDCILKYVEKPVELSENDISYMLYYAYPNTLKKPTDEELTIMLYKKVLSRELKNFPKNYFLEGLKGEKRAEYCVKYLCREVLNIDDKEVPKVLTIEILKKYKLKILLTAIYFSIYDLITSIFEGKYNSKDFN